MKIGLLLLINLIFTFGFSQKSMFDEYPGSVANLFYNPQDLTNVTLHERYNDLTRSEGKLVKNVALSGSRFTHKLHGSGKIIFFCPASDYLNKVKSHLLKDYPALDSLIHIHVALDPALNAFATVNNNIYVNVGLLARIENEAQLAFILSHEIMHIVNEHIINGTLQLKRDVDTYSKTDILVDLNIIELRKHEVSRENETQADVDGFELFLKSKYNPFEGVKAMKLLEKYNDYSLDVMLDNSLFFFENEQTFVELQSSYSTYNSAKQISKSTKSPKNLLYMTHPLIADRIKQMNDLLKHIPSDKNDSLLFVISEIDFQQIKVDAMKIVDQTYAESMDFISLFINSSARYNQYADTSENTIEYLVYALQGLMSSHLKEVDLNMQEKKDLPCSLLAYHYLKSNKREFATWTYQTFKRIKDAHPSPKMTKYDHVFINLIKSNFTDSLDSIFGMNTDSLVKQSQYNGFNTLSLNSDEIPYYISYSNEISNIGILKFNESKDLQLPKQGKVGVIGSNFYHIRVNEITDKKSSNILLEEKAEKLSTQAFLELDEDYNTKIESLLPNSTNYSTSDFQHYIALNTWLNERFYFSDQVFVSLYDDEISDIIQKDSIHYVFSSVNVSIRNFVFHPGITALNVVSSVLVPFSLPQLVINLATANNRKYQLSLIYNIETGALEFWDKRTFLEPFSSYHLYQLNEDIINTFYNAK